MREPSGSIYRLGGCRIGSPVPLPGLPSSEEPASAPCDIRIVRGELASDPSAEGDWMLEEGRADGAPLRGSRRWSRMTPHGRFHRYRFDYFEHAAEFVFAPDGSEVSAAWTENVSDADVAVLISGPVLGRALRLRGVHCLHATTVVIGGRAFSLLGPSGAGKSSFAAAMVRAGCALLSDDLTVCVQRGQDFFALPGQPGLRLWVDSAERLKAPDRGVRRIWPGIGELEKYILDVPRVREADGSDPSVPFGGVYLLGPRDPASAEIAVADLLLPHRVAILCRNIYGNMEPSREVRSSELAFFSRMAARVPVRTLRLPHGLDRIEGAAAAFIRRAHGEVA